MFHSCNHQEWLTFHWGCSWKIQPWRLVNAITLLLRERNFSIEFVYCNFNWTFILGIYLPLIWLSPFCSGNQFSLILKWKILSFSHEWFWWKWLCCSVSSNGVVRRKSLSWAPVQKTFLIPSEQNESAHKSIGYWYFNFFLSDGRDPRCLVGDKLAEDLCSKSEIAFDRSHF